MTKFRAQTIADLRTAAADAGRAVRSPVLVVQVEAEWNKKNGESVMRDHGPGCQCALCEYYDDPGDQIEQLQSEVTELREVIRKVRAAPDMTAVWHITESAILKWGKKK